MYYDDEARRFNFLSGLLFGGVLGAGLALIAAPHGRGRKGRWRRRKPPTARAASALHRLGDGLSGSLGELLAVARARKL